ncbi:AAA family ATPase [Paracoccus tibetensis]|uniref:AAA family ATPase n=1 Tax=Paracoccus tibetensis TaxID=336292 RepID=UPI0015871D09
MYISEIYASGFRCFDPSAPLQLKLSSGLNILVGPNDAGKSAIIDAARYVLWTRGDDYIRPDEHDFHVGVDGTRACDFAVRCTFDDLSADEEARFLEWCTNEKGKLRLHVCMRGAAGFSWRRQHHLQPAPSWRRRRRPAARRRTARVSKDHLSQAFTGRRARDANRTPFASVAHSRRDAHDGPPEQARRAGCQRYASRHTCRR